MLSLFDRLKNSENLNPLHCQKSKNPSEEVQELKKFSHADDDEEEEDEDETKIVKELQTFISKSISKLYEDEQDDDDKEGDMEQKETEQDFSGTETNIEETAAEMALDYSLGKKQLANASTSENDEHLKLHEAKVETEATLAQEPDTTEPTRTTTTNGIIDNLPQIQITNTANVAGNKTDHTNAVNQANKSVTIVNGGDSVATTSKQSHEQHNGKTVPVLPVNGKN